MIKKNYGILFLISIISSLLSGIIILLINPKKLDKKDIILISGIIGFSSFCLLCMFTNTNLNTEFSTFKFNC
jgi:hypothetical protein